MDWIDPRHASAIEKEASQKEASKLQSRLKGSKGGKKGRKSRSLATQAAAALAQPIEVWSEAFDHALALRWPSKVTAESTFLFSAVMHEQAEVLVRAGMPSKNLSAILSDSDPSAADSTVDVTGLVEQPLETLAFQWLDSADTYAHSALAVSALLWNLPDHAKRPGNQWLVAWMQAVIDRATAHQAIDAEPAICQLVLRCELPLLLGVATSAAKGAPPEDVSRAMDCLAELLECSMDNPAGWLVYGSTYLRASLATVLRCRVLADRIGLRKLFPPQQKALAGLLKHAARWSRVDGTQLLAATARAPRATHVWEALAAQTKRPRAMASAMQSVGLSKTESTTGTKKKAKQPPQPGKLPEPTHYCEEASGALMRSGWTKRDPVVALDFCEADISIEALGPRGKALLVGQWTAEVELEGQPQLQLDEWGELCWHCDEDVAYLELEAKFGTAARIHRQAALFREEGLLLLADTLLCERPGAWSVRSRIPLASGAHFQPERKTTEGRIVISRNRRCLVVPLSLPEWRRQPAAGTLAGDDDNLVVSADCLGRQRLYMPTVISLNEAHAKQPCTWRRLTVGEDLRIVGQDEAVAYRLQIGAEQWLFYKTLAPPTRRTALGVHTLADFYAGKFDADEGEPEMLVEVEPSDA